MSDDSSPTLSVDAQGPASNDSPQRDWDTLWDPAGSETPAISPDEHRFAPQAAVTPRSRVQVEAAHYGPDYLTFLRIVTYWHQARRVLGCGGHRVLEVGIGMGLTAWVLERWGFEVETLDLDPALRPTCAGDVLTMPFQDESFDTVLIAEVLEHLPYERFAPALAELHRVTRKNLIVTLPCPLVGFSAGINICGVSPKFFSFGGPLPTRPIFDGQHYWELGRRGYPKRRIRKALNDAGFEIEQEFRPGFSLYNYFFQLRKRPES